MSVVIEIILALFLAKEDPVVEAGHFLPLVLSEEDVLEAGAA